MAVAMTPSSSPSPSRSRIVRIRTVVATVKRISFVVSTIAPPHELNPLRPTFSVPEITTSKTMPLRLFSTFAFDRQWRCWKKNDEFECLATEITGERETDNRVTMLVFFSVVKDEGGRHTAVFGLISAVPLEAGQRFALREGGRKVGGGVYHEASCGRLRLYSLGELDEEGLLTKLGKKMAEFPLDPPLSKILLVSVDLGCSDEILTIIAMIQTGNNFYRPREKQGLANWKRAKFFSQRVNILLYLLFMRPREKQGRADRKRVKFFQPEGDHLTLLIVYEVWKAKNFSGSWCFENFVQSRSLRIVQDVRKQLLTIMDRYKLDVASVGINFTKVTKAITT
ncbi:uncharacterized protein LOC106774760 [Vigna radiata var. radiata]|uniref:RNA helicase n=1 Tax=Vigna radiata var. radiata TaxID=3916 RepID=A0A3Q0FGY8_VIGRR|nr:uncharacterized protein LOC106774760 [Vigna radiata var. radiata]